MINKNKKLTWLLAVLVLGTWGTVAHQLMNVVATTSPQSPYENVERGVPFVRDRFAYKDTLRDPFYPVVKAVPKRDTLRKVAMPLAPPPFTLSGILSGGKRRTAMVEGKNGETFFLNEGDTLAGIKLLRISQNGVVYSYGKRKLEWSLPQGL